MGLGVRVRYSDLMTTRGDMAARPLIAIVDDDKSIRNATSDMLKAAGFTAAAFEDAESFLRWPARASVACLVADVRMPGMSGVDLYGALVAAGQAIPTVIITAHPEALNQARARAVGICCYLAKPFGPDELLDCVGEALARPCSRPIPRS
jgi:FixJ family two-component response regulator